MLTQFFGNYLLEKQIIDSKQLMEALRYKHSKYKTLDTLAISSGYMSQEEAEDIHNIQTHMDGEFTELAFHMGYLTEEQTKELAEAKHYGYILLGNAVIELGFCSQDIMAKIVADYEFDYQLNFSNFLNFDKDKIDEMITKYYDFEETGDLIPQRDYASLLIKNLIRFVGDDFHLSGKIIKLPSLPNMLEVKQEIIGAVSMKTSIIGFRKFIVNFASRYACEDLTGEEEYIIATLQDFLNLHNGTFTISLSNANDIELELTPPHIDEIYEELEENAYILPIEFSFGIVYFCYSFTKTLEN